MITNKIDDSDIKAAAERYGVGVYQLGFFWGEIGVHLITLRNAFPDGVLIPNNVSDNWFFNYFMRSEFVAKDVDFFNLKKQYLFAVLQLDCWNVGKNNKKEDK